MPTSIIVNQPVVEMPMSQSDAFALIEQGHYEEAIRQYMLIREDTTPAITLYNCIIAYLCLRDYEAAAWLSTRLIEMDPESNAGHSRLAICQWCLHLPEEAIATWRQGLDALYADAARVEMPGMLLYAGVRLHDAALIREARRLLRKRMRIKQIANWPGAMAPYVLGKISADEFEQMARVGSDALLERHLCQYHFYRAVIAYEQGDIPAFERFMRAGARRSHGILEDQYYLANWEVAEGFPELTRE